MAFNRGTLGLVLAFVFVMSPARADLSGDLGAIVERYVETDSFHGTVLVGRGDATLFSQGYGLANLEHGIPNTPETRFVIRSISKQFTAAAILALEEEGKLSTSDLLSRHLSVPEAWKGITIHQLLTHSSGIADYRAFPNLLDVFGQYHSLETLVALFEAGPLLFSPGTAYRYSNPAYITLAWIIEKTSQRDFGAYLDERLFARAGLNETHVYHQSQVVPNRASGYWVDPDSIGTATGEDFSNSTGTGNVISTTGDLFRWLQALDADRVLNPESLQKYYAPYVQMGEGSPMTYAYGWINETVLGRHALWHNGQGNGFISQLLRFPDERLSIIILSNRDQRPKELPLWEMATDLAMRAFAGN